MSDRASGAPPTGVLLVNLGTPAAPTPREVRRYLREFLLDRRVVDLPRALWWPLLFLVVLPTRGRSSARLYRRIWTPDGSPLLLAGRRLRAKLAERLGPGFAVELAMRYGTPRIADALARLAERGVRELVLVPLFPQFSESTTGSVVARVRELLAAGGHDVALRVVPPYYDDPGFVAALAARVRARAAGGPLPHLLVSFHGIPLRYARRGDPYPEHCASTARALAAALDLGDDAWTLAYQSRFGREEWLRPYADEKALELAREHRRLLVACPGFTADCLETIDEIGSVLADSFRAAGGDELTLVPSLDDGDDWVLVLERLVRAVAHARPLAPGSA